MTTLPSVLSNVKTVATHSGPFHADEVLAVAVLLALSPKASMSKVVRTRDPKLLETADVVVDVGGVYNPETLRFDHHQKGGAGTRESNGIKYSAAGLVWKEFGTAFCQGDATVAKLVDAEFISAVCALDNGQGSRTLFDGIDHVTFSDTISAFNPTWLEESDDLAFTTAFEAAVFWARNYLDRAVAQAKARVAAVNALDGAISEATDSRIIVLNRFMPVMDDLITKSNTALYLVFPQANDWLVQCVPPTPGSFAQRKPLPAAWAGLRGADLATATGVADSVFCHNGRFIGGAGSREGAVALATLAANAEG